SLTVASLETRVWFGGKLVTLNGATVTPDRLGSFGTYYPYGEDRGTGNPPADREKFETYTRDSATGLDYAVNRYYYSVAGRFLSADPNSGGTANNPGSWNRYSYAGGDPAGNTDPSGLAFCPAAAGSDVCEYLLGLPDDDPGAECVIWAWSYGLNYAMDTTQCANMSMVLLAEAAEVQQTAPPEVDCFAQLMYRPVNDPTASKFHAVHTFWWVQADIGGQAAQFIISAGPAPGPKGTQHLNAYVTPGSDNGSGDNSRQDAAWSSGIGSWLCDQVDAMINAAKDFPANTIQYHPVGAFGFGGPNSNSAAHYFGIAGGFNPKPPLTAYGWNSYIPFP
ncbi:MAG: RHS repeat-associated core domain-containing protein, partial [Bryobacteraceae bacterium]